jgi:hypothetical protein
MGYRDDFYIVANVIGYTGSISDNPTVYFESNAEYGRITQAHDNADNIGRNKVRSNEGHSLANETLDGKYRAVERVGGKVTHKSRSVFVPIGGMSKGDKDVLYQAILTFQEAKSK